MGVGVTARTAVGKELVPTVVFIGRLSANKRPEHAIRAFGLVRRQMPDAQMWVIGSGPEEARLRRAADPGVIFLGHVSEEEKHERLARAHALVATSVREGWGLVVTEAAASGTVAIGYDVPGLRDSIGASGGVLTRADPASLATGLVTLLSSVVGGHGPRVRPAGVVQWAEVAAGILAVARQSESPALQVLDQAGSPAGDRAAGDRQGLSRVRAGLGVLGVALLPFGGLRDVVPPPILACAAFLALLAATLIGGVEGWSTRGGRRSQQRAAAPPAAPGAGIWPSRIGLAIVGLIAAIAAQSWFDPGRLLAGGDLSPVVGTAWLGRLFAPWSWSGSNLGGPAANETNVPFAAVYWLVHVLRGSPALAEDIWYTALFVGAAAACYLLLRALRVGPAGSTLGALAYVFNAHVVTIGTNPVFLAGMVLLAGLPAVVLTTASGRWALRKGILLLGASAPLLGYISLNPPLVFMIGALLASMPLLVGWLDGAAAARRALSTLALGVPLLALACSYWLLPTVLRLKIEATSALALQSSWTWTEGRATLANGFWLNNGWGWKYAAYYPVRRCLRQVPAPAPEVPPAHNGLRLSDAGPVSASSRGDGPPGASWNRRLSHGPFPHPAQHGHPSSRSPSLRSALPAASRLVAQGARPVPDARRARLLGPPRADHGGRLRETELGRVGQRVVLALSTAWPGTSSRGGQYGRLRGGARPWIPANHRSDCPRSPSGAASGPRQRARVLDSDGVLPKRFRSTRQSARAPAGRLLPDALHLGLLRSGQFHHEPGSAKRFGPG